MVGSGTDGGRFRHDVAGSSAEPPSHCTPNSGSLNHHSETRSTDQADRPASLVDTKGERKRGRGEDRPPELTSLQVNLDLPLTEQPQNRRCVPCR